MSVSLLEDSVIFRNKKYKLNIDLYLLAIKGKLKDVKQWQLSDISKYREHMFYSGEEIEITKFIEIQGPNISISTLPYARFYYFMYFDKRDLTTVYWDNHVDIPPDFITPIPFNYNILWNQLSL